MGFNKHDRRLLRKTHELVWRLYKHLIPQVPSGVTISQINKQGESDMSITGVPQGGSKTFEADALLNSVLDAAGFPAGSVDTWTSDDAAEVTIGPDSGPDVNEAGSLDQVLISVAAGAVGTAGAGNPASFNLSVSVQMPAPAGGSAPAPLVATANIPILPPVVQVPTAVVINQVD